MSIVSVHEAKTRLSRPLRRVDAGEGVVTAHGGVSIGRLVPLAKVLPRQPGRHKGFSIGPDLDEPLPDELWAGEPRRRPSISTPYSGASRTILALANWRATSSRPLTVIEPTLKHLNVLQPAAKRLADPVVAAVGDSSNHGRW